MRSRRFRAQNEGAHHRRRRQRHQQRDHHGDGQREREFLEKATDQPAHQQQRQEHRHQRQADRDHGEADFRGAQQRRLQAGLAGFEVARDVFEHDNGVVDDEAGRDRQRHQREIVEAETKHIHGPEGADDRDRHGDAWNGRGAKITQEHEDHENDEADRGDQRRDRVAQRSANRDRAIHHDGEIHVARQRRDQARQFRLHSVYGLDDIAARLA